MVNPLRGDEIRPCWEAHPTAPAATGDEAPTADWVEDLPASRPSVPVFSLFADLDL